MARPDASAHADEHGARGVAEAIRKQARRQAHGLSRHLRYAIVRKEAPLKAELTDSHKLLDGDDLVLGQWARHYDTVYSIDKGDTLVVQLMDNGDYLVVDVVSDTQLG